MSGIAGIFHLDGAPAEPELLRKMADALEYRGADGVRVWHDGPVGLVHRHFWTTPEDVGEEQPICSADGRHWITADARIDNREELIPFLTAQGYLTREIPTDAQVILAAYAHWGQDCAYHLIGDFAFAIWDVDAQSLYLARDTMGLRQLCYTVEGDTLYFGTTIGALLAALPQAPALNGKLIEDFLRKDYRLWYCQTVYQGLFWLPPAHILTVQGGKVRQKLYYTFAQHDPGYASADEWVEAFRSLFQEAIRCRLRSPTPVGILVGGGVDSSSVSCVAHRLHRGDATLPPVRLYSAVFDETPEADEREHLATVEACCPDFTVTRIPGDRLWALRAFGDDDGFPLDGPEAYTERGMSLALAGAAAADGCRVILMGEGANQILGHGAYYQMSALRDVDLRDWPREFKFFWSGFEIYKEGLDLSWFGMLARFCAPYCLPTAVRRILHAIRPAAGPDWLNRRYHNHESQCPLDEAFLMPPGLTASAQVAYRETHSAFIMALYHTVDRTLAYAGVERRLPFLDRRVMDLLLVMPPKLRFWRGHDRVILRKSMRGILPDSIRLRRDKACLLDLVHRGLREERPRIEALLSRPQAEALGFVNGERLRRTFDDYWQGRNQDMNLRQPLCLEAWLRARSDDEQGAGP